MRFETSEFEIAAKELNRVLGLTPAIKTKVHRRELMRQLKANIEEVVEEDQLSDETWRVINFLSGKTQVADEEEIEEVAIEEEQATTEEELVEKEVQDFQESFDVDLELELKIKKETLKQKKDKQRSADAKVQRQHSADRRNYVASLIKESKHDKDVIFEKAIKKYPEWLPATLNTLLTDCMNPKYNPLKKFGLVVRDEATKIMSFESKK